MRKPVFLVSRENGSLPPPFLPTLFLPYYTGMQIFIFNYSDMEKLLFCLVYYLFTVGFTAADLPSCIRAKCSHCKVPFIAQMCPIACSGCPPIEAQNHLTSMKEVKNSAEMINRNYASHVKVPFAQQIPILEANNRGNFYSSFTQSQPQMNGPHLRNFERPGNEGRLGQQRFVQYPPQQAQQTTNFGGFYGQPGNFQYPAVNNPFQPLSQQSFQTIQQPFEGTQPVAPKSQPILHAVPNVVDPLQRPRQLHNLPLQSRPEPHQDKWVEDKIIYGMGGASIDGIRRPGSAVSALARELKCPRSDWEPCVPKNIANKRFQNCCSRLGEGCSSLCSYDQNLTNIQLAVLTGRCPVNKVADMMICASGYEDATACCQAFGVFEPGFEHCKPYCNPSGGLPNDGMLAEKYRCLQKLQQIQRCFYLTQQP